MSKLNVTDVKVLENPAPFNHDLAFEIMFEAYEELTEDVEWKIIWVGSAESVAYDQVLDEIVVGPIAVGRHQFVFRSPAPDPKKIPAEDVIGITVVMITAAYRKQEFSRIGYYVNVDYTDPDLKENPPQNPVFERLERNILANNPRNTRCKIEWDDKPTGTTALQEQNGQSNDVMVGSPPPNDENSYVA